MAYEALANVLAQIGRGYESAVAEDRVRAQRLADVESERAYQDRVRKDAQEADIKSYEQKRKIDEESERRRIRDLPELNLRAEARTRGIDDTLPLGDVRKQLLELNLAEKLVIARAEAANAVDQTVLDAKAKADAAAAKSRAEADLAAKRATLPAAKALNDDVNATAKNSLQTEFNTVAADINALAPRVMNDAVAQAAAQVVMRLRQAVMGAATPDLLKKLGVTKPQFEADMNSGDIGRLRQYAGMLMVNVSPDEETALIRATQSGQAQMVSLLGRAQEQLENIRQRAFARDIVLDQSAYKGLSAFMQPAAAAAAAPTAGPLALPPRNAGAGATPVLTPGALPPPAAVTTPRLTPAPQPVPSASSWWSRDRDPEANRQAVSGFFTQTLPTMARDSAYGLTQTLPTMARDSAYGLTQRLNPTNYYPGWSVGVDADYAYIDPRRSAITRPRPDMVRLPDIPVPMAPIPPEPLAPVTNDYPTMRGVGVPFR
jgi:hypothetical protein